MSTGNIQTAIPTASLPANPKDAHIKIMNASGDVKSFSVEGPTTGTWSATVTLYASVLGSRWSPTTYTFAISNTSPNLDQNISTGAWCFQFVITGMTGVTADQVKVGVAS